MQTIVQRLARLVNRERGSRALRRERFQRRLSRQLEWRLQRLEQLEERILLSAGDYGDAPTAEQSGFASSYPTLLADNGAWHTNTGPILGATLGVESDGQPTARANGDDTDGDDDEDGVTFVPGFLTPGDAAATVQIDMTASPVGGLLHAWIDFNADGDWADAGEQIFRNTAVTTGTVHALTFPVPADAALGPTYARFRVSTVGNLGYAGWAPNGEVEDYRLSIAIPPNPHSLFPGEQFPVGWNPSSVVQADVNGDTRVDLITSNRLGYTVSVLLGLGDGTFAPQVTYKAGGQPVDVAAADLNGDDHIDIVAVNWLDDDVSVFLNSGDGTFADQVRYDVGRAPSSVALADLNGDGRVDIVASNTNDRSVSVLLGFGYGTFAAQVTYAVGTQPWGEKPMSVALADLNGDDCVDIATANDITHDMSVLLNRGHGTFAPYKLYPAGLDPISVAIDDLNGDSCADIVIANHLENNVSVYLNLGDGTFAEQVQYEAGSSPVSVALSDINHDGYVDVLAGYPRKEVAILLGLGDGTFAAPVSYIAGGQPVCVLGVDVNGDTYLDIVTANDGDHSVSVLLAYAHGRFPLQVADAVGDRPQAVVLGDLNGDTCVDIVAVNRNAHNVSVLLGLGQGSFAPQITYPVGTNPSAAALADLNGDHHLDIVTANTISDNISVLLGVGDGTFRTQVTYYATDKPVSVALADLNGDSYVDIVTANVLYDVSVFLGRGDGTFSDAVGHGVGYGPNSVALSDLNGDGHVDIVTANQSDDSVSVLLGLGDGTFATQVAYAVGDEPFSVALVDLDEDSYMDIVTANRFHDSVSVLLNLRDGTFATHAQHGVGSYPSSVVPDDVNGDGHMDLVAANNGNDNVSVLLGIGDGTFVIHVMYAVGTGPYGVAAADLNEDAQDDLVAANSRDNSVSVLLNRRGVTSYDCGDAPDPMYPTLRANRGARHVASGPTLGSNRDSEVDGQPTTDADGDDTTGAPDDEDGVVLTALTASIFTTTTASVTVDLQNADSSSNRLDAWIDFNQDGDWDDEGEQIFTSYDLGTTSGAQMLTFTVPQDTGANIVCGTTYARFRLSTEGELLPKGLGRDGEVEDYRLSIHAHVAGRHVFYNRSAWDGGDAAANVADDSAIAPDKLALLPGSKATFVNYTNYSRGINGIMIDIAELADPTGLSVADFEFRVGNDDNPALWSLLALDPALITVALRPGEGAAGSDRVTILFPDGAVKKTWLQVTVKATAATGLAAPDVHYWGNAIGDSGDSTGNTAVNVVDALGVRANPHTLLKPAPIDDAYDYNRDKQVNVQDELIVRANPTTLLTDLNLIDLTGYGGGEDGKGEGEWSDEVWVAGDDSSVFHATALQDNVAPPTALEVRSTTGHPPRLAALTSSLPEVTHLAERLSPPSHPRHDPSTLAWWQRAVDGQLPVGPVGEEQSHNLADRSHCTADLHGRSQQRTLDVALLELLAEWEQY